MSSTASLLTASESTASTRARAGGAAARPARLPDAMNIFELAWKTVDLARGAWQRPGNPMRHLAMHAFSLIPIGILLAAPNHVLFLLKNPADAAEAAAHGAALASDRF